MSAYQVVRAACNVYLANGSVQLLYKGGFLPAEEDLAEGEARRLLEDGFVEKVDSDGSPAKAKRSAKAAADEPEA